jgi:hypothetical protein
MESTVTRLARLRADIAAGTYAPPVDDVAESLVGWIARPEQFEGRGCDADDDGEAGDPPGREHRR